MCMKRIENIERLFRDNYTPMLRLAFRILDDESVARDIVHDIFASLVSEKDTADEDTSLSERKSDLTSSYLLRATRNRCLNHIRHLSVREKIHRLYSLENGDVTEKESETDWPDETTFLKITETVESDLSGNCREVVKMRFQQGFDTKKIAAALGISRQAVYKHLNHAIHLLRLKLNHHG